MNQVSPLDLADTDWHTIWITVLSALIVTLILYAGRSWHTLMQRMDSQDQVLADNAKLARQALEAAGGQQATASRQEQAIDGLRATVAKEFGGNSGGMRERINAIDDKVNEVSKRQVGISTALADLGGRFTQHLADQADAKPTPAPRKRSTKP